jgi:hypothetical protein
MPIETDVISQNKIAIVTGGSRGVGRNNRAEERSPHQVQSATVLQADNKIYLPIAKRTLHSS